MLLATTILAMAADPARAQGAAPDKPVDAEAEIVVTGIRASLLDAIQIKRKATNIVDAIAAEDIASFPDLNLGEALQRITGVTINRVAGEGQQVTVRGLAPDFTLVTLNGIPVMSGNSGRAVDFDSFASELFSSVVLNKTPTADMPEGALAASIDMRTPRPLDLGKSVFSVSAQGSWSDLSKTLDPRVSVLGSTTLADGTVGLLASASYSRRRSRFDTIEGFRWSTGNFDIDGNGVAEYQGVNYAVQPRVLTEAHDRERIGLTGAFQYAPNDRFQLSIDALYARFDDDVERYDLQASMTTVPKASQLTVENNNVVAGTFRNILQQAENISQIQPEEIVTLNGESHWDLSDSFALDARAGYSHGTGSVEDIRATYATTSNISYVVKGRAAILTSLVDLNDPAVFRHNLTIWNSSDNDNVYWTGALDGTLRTGLAALPIVRVGVQHASRQIERNSLAGRLAAQNSPLAPPVHQPFPFDNFLSAFDVPGVLNRFATARLSAARADPTVFPANFLPTLDPINSFRVRERSWATFARSDLEFAFGGIGVSADLGIRIVWTNQLSSGSKQEGSAYLPVRVDRSYRDVLPSANIRAELANGLIVRLSASKAMARPALLDLSPRATIAPVTFRANLGNPDLDPYRVKQLDASLEWYVGHEGLLSAAVFYKKIDSFVVNVTTKEPVFGDNLFDGNGKNVSGQIFDVTRPVNGTGGTVSGFELSYQQPFTFLPAPLDGFGLLANYTYADSKIDITLDGNPIKSRLPGQSPHSFNIVGYYEKGPVGIRLAYSWRDDFVFNIRSNTRLETQAAYGQLDGSVSVKVAKAFELTVDAINLTGVKNYLYDGVPERPMVWSNAGRTLLVGARARF